MIIVLTFVIIIITSKSVAVIYQSGILKKPSYEFTTSDMIFRKRFDSFHQFKQPPPLSYDDFKKGTDFSFVSSNDLIVSASDCFKSCRLVLDTITRSMNASPESRHCIISKEETLSVTKVCITNSLFLLKLSQHIKKGDLDTCKVSFDFETNINFCTIDIK